MLDTGQTRSKKNANHIAYLMYRVDDPVDPGVSANGFVLGVNKDDFVVFVGRVLIDPVRVQHSKISTSTANTLFRGRLE